MIPNSTTWAQDFKAWLIHSRHLNPASARVYTSRMQQMNQTLALSGISHGSVFAFLSARPNARPAYRSFVIFARETAQLELPVVDAFPSGPPVTIKPEEELLPRYPENVLDALLAVLDAGIPISVLKTLCWGHVVFNEEKGRYEAPDPEEKNTWIVLPRAAIDTLREWAAPEEGREFYTPLVVAASGSRKPVNWSWMRPTLAVRKRNQPAS